jgi:putative ABC transport system permease protein
MTLIRRLWFLLTRRQREDDLAEEMEFHRQMKEDALRRDGIAEGEVASLTQRAIGNDLLARERSRDVWIPVWLQDISQDFRFGARMLLKDRRFTCAAVIALGLGIGVNNSVFTIMNAALFRPLPFEESERIVDAIVVDAQGRRGPVAYADYLEWTRTATTVEALTAYMGGTFNLSEDDKTAERLRGVFLSANTFTMLRVAPFIGRDFTNDDDRAGAPSVAVLSYELWQNRYGGEPNVIGRTVRINSQPAVVIGVMPRQFAYPATAQIWQPLSASTNLNATNRRIRNLTVVGRLRAGVTRATAAAEFDGIAGQLALAFPDTNKNLRIILPTLQEALVGGDQARSILSTLMGAVTIVLLIACANVASLLLARSTNRAREVAVRSALGAGRWRIIRQLLVECLLIAVLATIAGLGLSRFLSALMATAFDIYEIGAPGSTTKPYWVDIGVDGVTIVFLGVLALFVSIAVGLIPSWHLSKTAPNDVLKEGGRAGGTTALARRVTGVLMIGQLALTVILLVGAAMLVRSFLQQYLTDPVIDPSRLVTARVVLPAAKYADRDRQRQFIRQLDERISTLPAFSSAALGSDIPLYPLGFASRSIAIEGTSWNPADAPTASLVAAGPRYFETLSLPILRGRHLTEVDARSGQEGVVVNQRFAARFFADGEAVGKRIQLHEPGAAVAPAWLTIVGVAAALPNFFPDRAAEPVVYVPLNADPGTQRAVSIIVRTADAKAGNAVAVAALREQVAAIDPDLPVFGVQTFDDALRMATRSSRTIGSWFASIALIAVVLATVGLYAITAHNVAQRAHEIGVRMALGARSAQVMWLFVRRTVIQLLLGLVIGIAGAVGIGRLLASFFRDTNPRDPLTIALVSLLLLVVVLSASIWPARRATRVDPVDALRAD